MDELRQATVAEMLADTLESLVTGPSSESVGSLWEKYSRDAIMNSGTLTDFLLAHRDWYHAKLVAIADESKRLRVQP